MKLHLLSDLHLEFGDWSPPTPEADAVVLAGDIWTRDRALKWAGRHFQPSRTIVLAGNHEHYGQGYQEVIAACRASAAELGCHFLENNSLVLEGVRILGATLWTNFALNGDGALQHHAIEIAREGMNDFRQIRWQEDGRQRRFHPKDAMALHLASRRFLEAELTRTFAGPTVVVTHHLPCRRSIPDRFAGDPLNPAFCSDMSDLIERTRPTLWLHGHSHDSADYRLAGCRIVCNPRGYSPQELNPHFDPALVLEV